MLYGLITLLLMLVFIGIVVWAWSARRKRTYEKAARMPLEEDRQPPLFSSRPSRDDDVGTKEKECRP